MPSREYQAEAENVIPDGFWPGEPIEAATRSELENLMLDAAVVLDRIGGAFSIVAIRQEIAPDLFVTVGYRGKWESFAPAQRLPRERPAPKVETQQDPPPAPDPDPLAEVETADDFPEDPEQQADDDFGVDAEAALAQSEA